jgi:hypothetical protein
MWKFVSVSKKKSSPDCCLNNCKVFLNGTLMKSDVMFAMLEVMLYDCET